MTQPLRQDVSEKQTWDLTTLFQTRDDWKKALDLFYDNVKKVTTFKGTLTTSANVLFNALKAYEQLYEQLVKVRTYAFLQTSVDGTNNTELIY